jgi:5-methylcytosine-specific restriction endonuclease McrA
MAPTVISREEARAAGLKRFFTGEPCPRGHIAERYVLKGRCVVCAKEAGAAWIAAHPEKALEYSRRNEAKHRERRRAKNRRVKAKWRAAHPKENKRRLKEWRDANLEKSRQHSRDWGNANRGKRAATAKQWRQDNPERALELAHEWRERNPERYRIAKNAASHRRRVRKLAAEGNHTADDIQALCAKQHGKCANCRRGIGRCFEVDHIQPLTKGGSNWPSNLQLLCPRCNRKKHNKDPIAWARENGRLL